MFVCILYVCMRMYICACIHVGLQYVCYCTLTYTGTHTRARARVCVYVLLVLYSKKGKPARPTTAATTTTIYKTYP